MTHPIPPGLRTLPIALILAAAAALCSAPASAQSAPAPTTTQPASPAITGTTRRLTDEQRDAILNAATEDRAAAARQEWLGSDSLTRGIHGEMGVMVGTNGTRALYGTALIPLGDNAGAQISFETSRFRYGHLRPLSR